MKASGILVAVLMTMAAGVSAADFNDLQRLKAADIAGQTLPVSRPVPTASQADIGCSKPHPGNMQEIIEWINCVELPQPPATACVAPKPGAPKEDIIAWINCVELPQPPATVCVVPKPGAPIGEIITWIDCVQLPKPQAAH